MYLLKFPSKEGSAWILAIKNWNELFREELLSSASLQIQMRNDRITFNLYYFIYATCKCIKEDLIIQLQKKKEKKLSTQTDIP